MKIGVTFIPLVSGIIILLFSTVFWLTFTSVDTMTLKDETQSQAYEIASDLEELIVSKIRIFETVFLNQWTQTSDPAALNSTTRWNTFVPPFFEFYSGYKAVNWIDIGGTVRIVYPLNENEGALNRSIVKTADGKFNTAFNLSRTDFQTHVSPIIPFYQGGVGFASYIPVIYNGTLVGFINVVLETTPLFTTYSTSRLLNNSYGLWVVENSSVIYSSDPSLSPNKDQFLKHTTLQIYDRTWFIYIKPLPYLIYSVSYFAHLPIFVVGVATFILSIVLTHFLYNDVKAEKERARERERLNAMMQRMDKLQALGTMAGGMAHNFNNLLMGIQGNVSLALLIADELSGDTQDLMEKLRNIEEIVTRSKDLTQQILIFSRQSQTEVVELELNEVIQRSISLLKRSTVLFDVNLKTPSPSVKANYGMLQQVFVNILNNAIESMSDLMPEERGVIEVHSTEKDGLVIVTIADAGKGMDEKTLQNAVEPFFTTKTEGTGLGLPMSIQYIASIGGNIDISSTPGRGTTVTISIPSISPSAASSSTSDEPRFADVLQGKKILVVEDDSEIEKSLSHLLTLHGSDVLSTNTAEQALFQMEDFSPDVAVIDVSLPGMDGISFLSYFKNMFPESNAVLITGFTELNVPQDIPVLYKPFSDKELLRALYLLLQ